MKTTSYVCYTTQFKFLHHSCGLWFVRLSVKIVKPNPPPRYWQSKGYFESMAGVTLDECIEEFNLSDDILDTKCSDEHILNDEE